MLDYLLLILVVLGVAGGIGFYLGPTFAPTWYPRVLRVIAVANLAVGFNIALGVLNGVALVGHEPAWFARALTACWLLQGTATTGLLLSFVQPTLPRLRARLWPAVPPAQPIEFGTALPIP